MLPLSIHGHSLQLFSVDLEREKETKQQTWNRQVEEDKRQHETQYGFTYSYKKADQNLITKLRLLEYGEGIRKWIN